MPLKLFAYGTLQPDFAPPSVSGILRQLKFVGNGRARGSLYDLGDYPGAIFDGSVTTEVHGVVYAVPDEDSIWAALDAYEHVPTLYVRVRQSVMLDDGTTLDCWAYAYRQPVGVTKLIPSGKYRR